MINKILSFLFPQPSPEEMAKAEQIVEDIIRNNKIAVFSKTYCPYCQRAKALLKQLGEEFFAIELDVEDNGAAIQNYLLQRTGQRTVPNIFINQNHVGGCDDLMAANQSGKLQELLKA